MKKHMLWLLMAATLNANAVADTVLPMLKPSPEQAKAASKSAEYLTRYHLRALPLDDAMSIKIFDRYLKSLDSEKVLFTNADIEQFSAAKTTLDDAIRNAELDIAFTIFHLYQQRVGERFSYARELLNGKFDFTTNEVVQNGREKAAWPKSEEEMRDLWRKRVKNDWLRLKLANREEKAIREMLDKRYESQIKRSYDLNQNDAFQAFLNAYTTSIDPHTNYIGPRANENFKQRLGLVGVGLVLQHKDDYMVIRELVPGGTAALSGKLNVGDRIMGVGQETGNVVDVLGWRLDDVVPLLRGAPDSVVRLDVLPANTGVDGAHKTVSLNRKKISMDDASAKKSIIILPTAAGGKRIGVIALPTFYLDWDARAKGEKNYKSATRDVAKLLLGLKEEKVDGIVIDLRNNGGGSFNEAVELTGLFIDKGPVVQQSDSLGRLRVESDLNSGYEWEGPMAVLINRSSASASEIFAAAIQDYGRGVVIGETSFGHGSVQQLVPLGERNGSGPQLGEMKMTTSQFFRVNGGSTQLRGVVPDVVLPQFSDDEAKGESSYDNTLPWTEIKAADFTPFADLHQHFATLQQKHQARIAKDKDFQYLLEEVEEFRKQQKVETVSLNEAVRRKQLEARQARMKTRPTTQDVVLSEAARVMADEVELQHRSGLGLIDKAAAGTASSKETK